MRESALIVSKTLGMLAKEVKPGVSTLYLDKLADFFTKVFANQPQTFVHLDYHSRNLLVVKDGSTNKNTYEINIPGVIDFQDAMIGPSVYDLASLFQDAYISWDRIKIEEWLNEYNIIVKNTKLEYKDTASLIKAFDIVGLQRHIKNLGIFARLHHRDNKSNYLNDIPMLLKYIEMAYNRYPELAELKKIFNENPRFVNLSINIQEEIINENRFK